MTIQDALIEVLVDSLTEGKGVTRRPLIIAAIRNKYPQFNLPRLDLIVGVHLNDLVAADILSRTTIHGTAYYHVSAGYVKRWAAKNCTIPPQSI